MDNATTLNIQQMSDISKETAKDAIEVSKSFFADPIGGIYDAYIKVGDRKAKSVGIFFMIISFALLINLRYMSSPDSLISSFVTGSYAFIGLQLVVFMTLIITRLFLSGKGSLSSDIYISGIAIFPFLVMLLVGFIIGAQSYWGNYAYLSIGIVYTTLILFSGLTKIMAFSESKASIIIAVILFLMLNTMNLFN